MIEERDLGFEITAELGYQQIEAIKTLEGFKHGVRSDYIDYIGSTKIPGTEKTLYHFNLLDPSKPNYKSTVTYIDDPSEYENYEA